MCPVPTTMQIDGYEIPLEYDPDEDRFYGLVEISDGGLKPGWISFHGRDPDELREAFREALREHQEAA
jgi:predicted HicB family RNase H-like nuclease